MTKSSRFLSLAVAFLGLGLVAGCGSPATTISVDPVAVPSPEVSDVGMPQDTAADDAVIAPEANPNANNDAPLSDEAGEEEPATPENPAAETPDESPSEEASKKRPGWDLPGRFTDDSGFGHGETPPQTTRTPIRDSVFVDRIPPQLKNVSHPGDGKRFTVVFNEPVSLDSMNTAFTLERFDPFQGGFLPVAGSLALAGEEGDARRFVRFTADEPFVNASTGIFDPVIVLIRITIAGSDSPNPSRAVKDLAGNSMAKEFSWTGTCRETPAGALYDVECK